MEYESQIKDQYDRPIINYARPGNMQDPAVSSYLIQNGFKPEYPENKKFATCISHDVDHIFIKSNKKQLLKELLKADIKNIKKEINRNFFRKFDDELDLSKLIKFDSKHNVRSTYYFLAIEKDSIEDYNYSLKEVKAYMNEITALGNEIGLHGSRKAYNNSDALSTEKNRLSSFSHNVIGYRNHFLKFEIPTTWNILAKEGLKYDTTFGAASCPGFRNGMCFPFQPYDLNNKKWIDIYELPLIAMDVSFFLYMQLDYETAFELFKSLVKTTKVHNGVFTFLWHNNYMTGEMGEFYERCIQHLIKEDTWFATGDEIINWWDDHHYFQQQNEILKKVES